MKGKNDRRFRSSPAVLLSLVYGDVGGLCKRVRRLREWVPAGSDYGNVWRIEDQIFRENHITFRNRSGPPELLRGI